MISKKIKILISGALVSVLLVSSPFNSRQVKAIVGVDDAILIATLGTLAVGGTLACYGIAKSGIIGKTVESLGDTIQDIGSGWKNIEDGKAIAKSLISALPSILDTYDSEISNTKIQEKIETNGQIYYFPFSLSNTAHVICQIEFPGSSGSLKLFRKDFSYTGVCASFSSSTGIHSVICLPWNDSMGDICFGDELKKDLNLTFAVGTYYYGDYYLEIPAGISIYSDFIAPSLSDVENVPTSISLDKAKVESIAADYAEKNPQDNNGDKNVDYGTLIPFVLDMLEKDLGDGTITPENLSNKGIVSYVYEDGSVQGMYPYKFDEGVSNLNNSNTNNITINNGSDVSDEEKNGVLNLIDGGLRATSERFESLSESFAGFKNTISGIFSFFPQDVQNVLFLAIILMAVFFVLGLRR